MTAILMLENGRYFYGQGIGALGSCVGELVFNTAMSGYQEVLTDPSYCQQIVTFTYPHIGNTGVNQQDEESSRVQVSGLVVRALSPTMSNWRSNETLEQYLCRHRIVSISDIDTRELTRILREEGAQTGCIQHGEINIEKARQAIDKFERLPGRDLTQQVTTDKIICDNQSTGALPVVLIDFGVKKNICRELEALGCSVTIVPATTTADEIIAMAPVGVILSNGPGDPCACDTIITQIQQLIKHDIPLLGICLGYQLLALALGAKTSKMKFGHHGINHPVQDLLTGRVLITSQNHGFSVEESSLPQCLHITHRSLFDQTIQGFSHLDKPISGFQGHPESSPGPHDAKSLFSPFIRNANVYKKSKVFKTCPEEMISTVY